MRKNRIGLGPRRLGARTRHTGLLLGVLTIVSSITFLATADRDAARHRSRGRMWRARTWGPRCRSTYAPTTSTPTARPSTSSASPTQPTDRPPTTATSSTPPTQASPDRNRSRTRSATAKAWRPRRTVTVWVDTTNATAVDPNPTSTTSTSTRAPPVGFTAANCSPTTPTHRTRPSPSSPCPNPPTTALLTGNLTTGFIYTPTANTTLVGTDTQLHYLVTDPDGHVAQGTITIRILAANDTIQPPVARADVARTNLGTQVSINVRANDFANSPNGFDLVEIDNPAHGTVSNNGSSSTPPTPASPASTPSPTPSATTTASPPRPR